jgi:hypothetical protein
MSQKDKQTLTLHRDTLKVLDRSARPEKGRTLTTTTTWLTQPGICGPTMNY